MALLNKDPENIYDVISEKWKNVPDEFPTKRWMFDFIMGEIAAWIYSLAAAEAHTIYPTVDSESQVVELKKLGRICCIEKGSELPRPQQIKPV